MVGDCQQALIAAVELLGKVLDIFATLIGFPPIRERDYAIVLEGEGGGTSPI